MNKKAIKVTGIVLLSIISIIVTIITLFGVFIIANYTIKEIKSRDYSVIEIYDADYIEIYNDTLDCMFDGNWEVVGKKSKTEWTFIEIPKPSNKSTRYKYTVWKIKYTDIDGKKRIFELNNHDSMKTNIFNHIQALSLDYYSDNYAKKYSKGFLNPKYELKVVYGQIYNFANYEEYDSVKKYVDGLETPDGAINLITITPKNVFKKFPVFFKLYIDAKHLKINNEIAKQIEEDRQLLLNDMNEYSGYSLNIGENMISYSRPEENFGGFEEGILLINGSEVNCFADDEYIEMIYNRYKGMFWD